MCILIVGLVLLAIVAMIAGYIRNTPHKDSNQVFSFHDRDVSVLVHLAHCKDKYTE